MNLSVTSLQGMDLDKLRFSISLYPNHKAGLLSKLHKQEGMIIIGHRYTPAVVPPPNPQTVHVHVVDAQGKRIHTQHELSY